MLKVFLHTLTCLVDEHDVEIIDAMSPTIKNIKLEDDILDLHLFKRFEDIIGPFTFLTSLHLSSCPVVQDLQFIWFFPFTIGSLDLDKLYLVPADEFVNCIPMLKKSAEHPPYD